MHLRPPRLSRHLRLVAGVVGLLVVLAAGVALVRPAGGESAAAEPAPAAASAPVPDSTWFRLPSTPARPIVPNSADFAAHTDTASPLLLFLPATGERPSDYRLFLNLAADHGYHVLGLDYWNLGHSVARTCGRHAACYGEVQRNRFDGSHPFRASHVDPRNSVLTRLTTSLSYLQRTQPDAGWNAYVRHDHVQWSDIVLAGHSQGGGESAWIAHNMEVRGVLMFGSPIVTDDGVVATWAKTPSATPVSRMVAFDNTHDGFWPRIRGAWRALGFGTPKNVTDMKAFGGHAMISTTPMPHAHIRLLDDATPITHAGVPLYEPVWNWMLARFA